MPKLPSVYVTRFCGSSKATYLDRGRAVEQLRQWATALLERDPRVVEVRLFGSLARNEAVPGSGADVLIILDGHPEPRWFDRIPEFYNAFARTDMPVEVFPYTREELDQLELDATGPARSARNGMVLAA